VRTERKPQISPLRYAPVEMTILFEHSIPRFQEGPWNCRSLGSARDDKGKDAIELRPIFSRPLRDWVVLSNPTQD
jgi:hypothetical protein